MMFNMFWRGWDVITAKNVTQITKNHHRTSRTTFMVSLNMSPVNFH